MAAIRDHSVATTRGSSGFAIWGRAVPISTSTDKLRWLTAPVLLATIGLATAAAVVSHRYGSLASALGALEGRPLLLDTYLIDAGKLIQGEDKDVEFRISNRSKGVVRILGARASCVCMQPDELPFDVLPGSMIPFRLRLKVRAMKIGSFSYGIDLYTDCRSEQVVSLRIRGEVVESVASRTNTLK